MAQFCAEHGGQTTGLCKQSISIEVVLNSDGLLVSSIISTEHGWSGQTVILRVAWMMICWTIRTWLRQSGYGLGPRLLVQVVARQFFGTAH